MKIINLTQGSPEWHQHRSRKGIRNASESAIAMGEHPLISRNDLLAYRATGVSKAISDYVEKYILPEGHRAERLARPIAEVIIGEELSPVTGVEGDDSASFDGIVFDSSVWLEHKSLNAELLDILSCPGVTGADLPLHHQIQMESQAKVCDGEKGLFMASKWDDDGSLIEELHCWYTPNLELRARIDAAWDQFFKDEENYKPSEIAEMPKAEVTIELPALFVHAKGEITEHNMEAFGVALTAKLAEVRAIALITDQDFSNAKEAAKKFRSTAKAIALSKEAMLAQTETIGEAARKMDAWAKDLNTTALQLEKDVEREDLAKKRVMVGDTAALYAAHIEALEAETRPIRLNLSAPIFAEAIKGKSKYASMQGALDDMLAQGRIAADAVAKDVRAKLAWCKDNAAGMSFLFPDLQQIIGMEMEAFTATIANRIRTHKDAEAEREAAATARIEAQAKAKAEADATAKLESERAAMQAEEERKARAKVAAEQAEAIAKADAEAQEIAKFNQQQTQISAVSRTSIEAAAIEERRKQAQLAEQEKPFQKPQVVQAAKPKCPSRDDLINAIADHYEVDHFVALEWLETEFQHIKEAA